MNLNIEQNKIEYIKRFQEYIGRRKGADGLLNFITSPERDFFTAPASTNDVLAVPGGSCQYALMLFDVAMEMFSHGAFAHVLQFKDDHGNPLVTKEMIATATLLSALDNVMVYSTELKNRKSYDPDVIAELQARGENVRSDSNGTFVWESYQAYTYDDLIPLGDGARALSFAQMFLSLKKEEILALRWSKTGLSYGHDRGAMWSAFNKGILAVALQNAHATVRFLLANESHYAFYSSLYGGAAGSSSASEVPDSLGYFAEEMSVEDEALVMDASMSASWQSEQPIEQVGTQSMAQEPTQVTAAPQPAQIVNTQIDPSILADLAAMDAAMFGE